MVEYHDLFEKMGEVELALREQRSQLEDYYTKVLPPLAELAKNFRSEALAAEAKVTASQQQASQIIVGTIGGVMLVCLLGTFFVARGISRPVRNLTRLLTRLAEGDTDIRVPRDTRRDEIGEIHEATRALRTAVGDAFRLRRMVEDMPSPVMTINLQNRAINYMNRASEQAFARLTAHLPVAQKELMGAEIGFFLSDAEAQGDLLAQPDAMPFSYDKTIGDDVVRVEVSAILDRNGDYMGPMFAWSIVTEQLRAEREAQRLINMVEEMPTAVMTLRRQDNTISYRNAACRQAFERIGALLPEDAGAIDGVHVGFFLDDADTRLAMLADPAQMPFSYRKTFGDEILRVEVSAILDRDGNFIGPMLAWTIVTEQVKAAEMVREVAELVATSASGMERNANNMSTAAEQTDSQSQAVANASERSAANVQSVAAATEQLSASIGEISTQVAHSTEISTTAVTAASGANDAIEGLVRMAGKIGDVVGLITEIADQTNLLALNATIEAARAGDAGRGFAVVASEVKSLAQQTAEATEQITHQIKEIQGATTSAVGAIKDVTGTIRDIREIATVIASAIDEQTATTHEIFRNVQEAAASSEEVTTSIRTVVGAAASTGTEPSSVLGSARELTQHALRLKQNIGALIGSDVA